MPLCLTAHLKHLNQFILFGILQRHYVLATKYPNVIRNSNTTASEYQNPILKNPSPIPTLLLHLDSWRMTPQTVAAPLLFSRTWKGCAAYRTVMIINDAYSYCPVVGRAVFMCLLRRHAPVRSLAHLPELLRLLHYVNLRMIAAPPSCTVIQVRRRAGSQKRA